MTHATLTHAITHDVDPLRHDVIECYPGDAVTLQTVTMARHHGEWCTTVVYRVMHIFMGVETGNYASCRFDVEGWHVFEYRADGIPLASCEDDDLFVAANGARKAIDD